MKKLLSPVLAIVVASALTTVIIPAHAGLVMSE